MSLPRCIVATIWLLAVLAPIQVYAAEALVSFDHPEQTALYQQLLKEYRCVKCQNQNLADSNASVAGDLRREIREQILAGRNKQDIDQYLVSRFGEFVLYRPRFTAKTAILWISPFVLLLVAVTTVVLIARGRREVESNGATPSDEHTEFDYKLKRRLDKARLLLSEKDQPDQ